MSVIIVSGLAGSGKDTVGKYLVDNHGYTRLAFADAVKDEVHMLYPYVPRVAFDTPEGKNSRPFKDSGQTARDKLIEIGENRKKVDPLYWIRIIASRIRASPKPRRFVITDCRFVSEHTNIFALLDDIAVVTHIRVERPEAARKALYPGNVETNSVDALHQSPITGALGITYVQNDSDLETLHSRVRDILEL